jgi:hypothetical protein
MSNIIRRQLLAGLPAMLLSSLPWRCATASNAKASIGGLFHDVDLLHGCIVAKNGSLHSSVCKGSAPKLSIDFWTFRVSEIEANELPANVGKVVVWDDVFSSRGLHRRVGEIIEALGKYYNFDVALSSDTFGFHLENCSEMGPTIARILPDISVESSSARIALIDIESFGVSRLDWTDILPHLRGHYNLVVGFAHFPGNGPTHWRAVFGEDIDHSNTWRAITHCDLSFLTSDALLGFNQILECDVRQPHLNAMLHKLIIELSTTEFLDTVTAEDGAPFFGIGALPQSPGEVAEAVERQRRVLWSEFSDRGPELPIVFAEQDKRSEPLINAGLSVWPLRAASTA